MTPETSAVPAGVTPVDPAAAPPPPTSAANSYSQILKASAVIGGSSVVNLVVSVVRAKAMALLVGPAGVGLLGLYGSIFDLTHSVAGMGINSSGVRQIAEAVGSGETERVTRTAAVLLRTSMIVGILGAALLAVFCVPISTWTFGTDRFAVPVAVLSLAVLLRQVCDGQKALLQGMRRIADLARIEVLGAVVGAAISLALVYVFREQGIVLSLVTVAALNLFSSWWYRRKVHIPATSLTVPQIRSEAGELLKLGSVFMASAVLTTGAAYAVRSIVGNRLGLDAAGLYQSAWALGGLYVGFILQAMGTDFYPRLTAVANNHAECNRMVNEQAEISLLLAGPGVLATLTFAPLVIALFYDTTFSGAVEPLRWICLGMALRVIAWPMGFIVLAKGAKSIFFWTEVAATIVHVGLAFVLVKPFGLAGATMAFFGLYVWHGLLIYAIVRRLSGFRWSTANLRTGLLFLPMMAAVFCGFLVLPLWTATLLGTGSVLASGLYSLRALCRLVSLDRVPRLVRDALEWFRIVPAATVPQFENGA
jgi:antigen flippase